MGFLKFTGLRKEALDMQVMSLLVSKRDYKQQNGWVFILESWDRAWYGIICNLAFILQYKWLGFYLCPTLLSSNTFNNFQNSVHFPDAGFYVFIY